MCFGSSYILTILTWLWVRSYALEVSRKVFDSDDIGLNEVGLIEFKSVFKFLGVTDSINRYEREPGYVVPNRLSKNS